MFAVLIVLCFMILYFIVSRDTPLEISFSRGRLVGLLYFAQIFIAVLIGTIFYFNGTYGKYAVTFFVTDENARATTYFVWYAILVFLLLFALLTRRRYGLISTPILTSDQIWKINSLLVAAVACILVTTCIFYAFGMRNALVRALLSGKNIVGIRLENRYSGIPTVAMSYFMFLLHFISILVGVLYRSLTRIKKWLYFALLVYAMSWLGNKSLIFYTFLELYIAKLAFAPPASIRSEARFTISKNYLRVGAILVLVFIAFLGVASLQIGFSNSAGAAGYLIQRGLLGQVAGVYEEFGAKLHNVGYISNSIPFLNYLFDQNHFNKDLMMMTWGASLQNAQDTGVMNSLFVGEAFAIGGYPMVILSPFIVAISLFCAHVVFAKVLRLFWGISKTVACNITVLTIASTFSLTDDLEPYPFMKLTIMQILFLTSLFIGYKILIRFRSARRTPFAHSNR